MPPLVTGPLADSQQVEKLIPPAGFAWAGRAELSKKISRGAKLHLQPPPACSSLGKKPQNTQKNFFQGMQWSLERQGDVAPWVPVPTSAPVPQYSHSEPKGKWVLGATNLPGHTFHGSLQHSFTQPAQRKTPGQGSGNFLASPSILGGTISSRSATCSPCDPWWGSSPPELASGWVGAASTSRSLCGCSSEHIWGCAEAERSHSWRAGGCCRPGMGPHKPLCLQPGLAAWLPFKPPGQDEASLELEKVSWQAVGCRGMAPITPMGTAPSLSPAPVASPSRGCYMSKVQKCPQTASFCLFPNLQLPQALLPPGFWESARTKPCPASPTVSPPLGWSCPCHRQCSGECTQVPFCHTHMSWIT